MIDLFLKLTQGSLDYTINRIDRQSNQIVYFNVINKVMNSISKNNLPFDSNLLSLIVDITEDELDKVSKRDRIFTSKVKYITLASDMLIDIYESLERRFVTGGESVHFVR